MLEQIFHKAQIKNNTVDLEKWGTDWTKIKSRASMIVFPEEEEQIIDLIRLANEESLKIVPSGGRTGLSGGAVALDNEIVLSLERMNKILDFNRADRIVKCQSGVITKDLQDFAVDQGLYYPVNFASAGSSQIGGNIATNAGGIKVIRYGLTRNWVSGIRIINGLGEAMSFNKGLVKNASGYDFRHLIIGSEGTLGVITEADICLTTPPPEQVVMLIGLSNPKNLTDSLSLFSQQMQLSAFEFFSYQCLEKVREKIEIVEPFSKNYKFYALLEFDKKDENKAEKIFESGLKNSIFKDGVISSSQSQLENLWKLRENISESLSHYQPYKNDISIKVSNIPDFIKYLESLTQTSLNIEICIFGHIGDGNIHINLLKKEEITNEEFINIAKDLTKEIYENISSYNGSISAEHGIGYTKKEFLSYTRSESEIQIMKQVKKIFDPNQTLNPGKLL